MTDDFAYDLFLSHNAKDKPQVRRLAERLKAAGVRVWLDEWVIKAGDNIIALKVDEGLEQSRVLLLCISPAALASKLKQLIAESIPWDKLPWTSTPRLLVELKNAVMAMRDESDIRLLRFAELAQRLEQALPGEKFGESDLRTAVALLANHGLVRLLKFGDLVLLRPDLINGNAGAVIRAARAHTDEIGCVLEADIYRRDFDFTGVERLKHRPEA